MARIKSKQISTELTGSYTLSGSLRVEGQTVLDSLNTGVDSLIVSGSMKVVDQKVNSAIASSSIFVQNLGTIASRDQVGIIDLGGFGG
tara:strand:- start:94 stop:357 length:264 start_codon:yes stop_codon:yes gene_type:complete